MKHKPITCQDQYMKVAYRIEQLKNAEPATAEAIEYRLMTKLIVEYEIERLNSIEIHVEVHY
jgi:hypothetical protein